MTREIRRDLGSTGEVVRTPEGFLRTSGRVTRSGIFQYRAADGTVVRELRHPDDVFAKESLDSLAMVPVTNRHPPGLVTAANAKELTVGHAGDSVRVAAPFVEVPILLTDAEAIRDAEAGVQQLSCGYEADTEDEPGEYEGQPFDRRQRNIRYNHVALVPAGRAGPDVRLRMDGWTMDEPGNPAPQNRSMGEVQTPRALAGGRPVADKARVRLNVRRYDDDGDDIGTDPLDIDEDAMDCVQRMADRHDALAGNLRTAVAAHKDVKGKYDALNAEHEKLKGQLATALKENAGGADTKADADLSLPDMVKTLVTRLQAAKDTETRRADGLADPAKVAAAVKLKVALISSADRVLKGSVKLDDLLAMTPVQVHRAVLDKLGVKDERVKTDDAYAGARFDAEMERLPAETEGNPALAAARAIIDGTRQDGAAGDEEPNATASRLEMLHRLDEMSRPKAERQAEATN